jgi:hypothetical protein
MTRTWLARTALAALIGCGVWAGLARADGWDAYPKTPPQAQELPPGHPPVDNSPSKHPLWDWVAHGRPLGCWASFNGYGCSSLHSECGFIFGSCRTFYGEPCLKGAPPSALPPWAGPESGYHVNPPYNYWGQNGAGVNLPPPGYWGPNGAGMYVPPRPGCGCP